MWIMCDQCGFEYDDISPEGHRCAFPSVVTAEKAGSMTFDEYQKRAAETAIYDPEFQCVYPILGLVNEAGEVAGKYKKYMRDGTYHEALREQLKQELGDTLWYLSAVARDMDLTLGEIASANLTKLADRQQRGVLQGSGDDR